MQGPKKVYVDGSFLNNEVRWAYLVYEQDDTLIQSAAGVLKSNEEVLSGRQVAGELEAVIQAVKWATDNNVIVDIYYDYTGIYNWVSDYFDSSSQPWGANKTYNQNYRKFISQYRSKIRSFLKVKAHSGDEKNSLADKLAKTGISSINKKSSPSKSSLNFEDHSPNLAGFLQFLELNKIVLTKKQKEFFESFFSGKNICLTGPAGTGKSFCVDLLREFCFNAGVKLSIAASTGIAALNVGGMTLHSFSGIGLGDKDLRNTLSDVARNKKALERIKHCKILFIDEISMVSGELLDKIDGVFKHFRKKKNLPFGGIRIVACGDALQLPPVFNNLMMTKPQFFFESNSWKNARFEVIELDEIKRQSNNDFITLLNNIRLGKVDDLFLLESRIDKSLAANGIVPVKIFAINRKVDEHNLICFNQNPNKIVSFHAKDTGEERHVKSLDKNCLAPKVLDLKVGAQVILLSNIDAEGGWVNGTIGVISGFEDHFPVLKTPNGKTCIVGKSKWEVKEQIITETGIEYKSVASREQIPLKLAYAISCHKVQGQTLDFAEVDLGNIFEYGQAYTALSRVKSLEGLSVRNFKKSCIKADPKCLEFYGY